MRPILTAHSRLTSPSKYCHASFSTYYFGALSPPVGSPQMLGALSPVREPTCRLVGDALVAAGPESPTLRGWGASRRCRENIGRVVRHADVLSLKGRRLRSRGIETLPSIRTKTRQARTRQTAEAGQTARPSGGRQERTGMTGVGQVLVPRMFLAGKCLCEKAL